MKKIKIFSALFASLAVGFMLTAFMNAPTTAPQKVIVDEVVFITQGAALVQNPTLTLLNNLPTLHDKRDTTKTVKWYDDARVEPNKQHEGYFVRIEKLGTGVQAAVKVLEFKMVLKPDAKTVEFYLTSANATAAQKKISAVGKPEIIMKKKIRIKSGDGLKCDLTVDNFKFTVDSIKYGAAANKFRVVTFSKDHINQ